jgi:hypothetical protein
VLLRNQNVKWNSQIGAEPLDRTLDSTGALPLIVQFFRVQTTVGDIKENGIVFEARLLFKRNLWPGTVPA